MKYKIVQESHLRFKVYSRPRWWPFWTDRSTHYVSYDKPQEVQKYGGFWSDIGYKTTEYGWFSSSFGTQAEAKERIADLKRWAKTIREEKKETPQVVYTSDS